MKTVETDIVIIGAGIAGSWMLRRLLDSGYDALLLESASAGAVQTTRSQGIIHGGIKYALNGVLSQASDAIKDMPARWRQCLQGEGEIDLRGVTQLSDAHYLWSQQSLGAKITSFFAKKAMSGRVDAVHRDDYPQIFCDPAFKGNLYKLNEVVLDVPSVLEQLLAPVADRVLQLDSGNCIWEKSQTGDIEALVCEEHQVRIRAQHFVFAAGKGNQAILDELGITQPKMQLRPLHMVAVSHTVDLPIYAHCIGASSKPLVTVTHHPHGDGRYTWYLGGDIAESGIDATPAQQIERAKQLMAKLLPWIDLSTANWQTLRIERAEPKQNSLSRPDAAFCHAQDNYIVAWPTKLALAPDLADKVLQNFHTQQLQPRYCAELSKLETINRAQIAAPLWAAS
ncbi:MAG: FAD-dependent oxidoreductase [Pseudomonadales bacterium]